MGFETGRRLSAALDGMEYAVREPSWRELRRVAFLSAVPFVGFGVMDNAIMIVVSRRVEFFVGSSVLPFFRRSLRHEGCLLSIASANYFEVQLFLRSSKAACLRVFYGCRIPVTFFVLFC